MARLTAPTEEELAQYTAERVREGIELAMAERGTVIDVPRVGFMIIAREMTVPSFTFLATDIPFLGRRQERVAQILTGEATFS